MKNIIAPNQFGSRKGHSTEDAILKLQNNIQLNLNQGFHTIAVFIDIKKAYDSLDHKILLLKVNKYGIGGKTLDWIASYLDSRLQNI